MLATQSTEKTFPVCSAAVGVQDPPRSSTGGLLVAIAGGICDPDENSQVVVRDGQKPVDDGQSCAEGMSSFVESYSNAVRVLRQDRDPSNQEVFSAWKMWSENLNRLGLSNSKLRELAGATNSTFKLAFNGSHRAAAYDLRLIALKAVGAVKR